MKCMDFCVSQYEQSNSAGANGIACNEENVKKMLELALRVFNTAGATFSALEHLIMSKDGAFDKANPSDVLALTFDALTSENRNSALWYENNGESIRSELLSTLGTMMNGPYALAPDPKNSVTAKTYEAAKLELVELLAKRYRSIGGF